MAKKINHRERGGHRELLFSLCPLFSLWFSEPIPEDSENSPQFYLSKNRSGLTILRRLCKRQYVAIAVLDVELLHSVKAGMQILENGYVLLYSIV
ncbi:MAG: hypothetical protein C5S47_03430 [Candidatus Methanogasteraceae archaeon]|nr:MAG: hypothetical protein C5S47_03430 [ANME-2 cluster archaeon]